MSTAPQTIVRVSALAGVAAVLIQQAVSAVIWHQPRQGWGFVVLAIAVPAVLATVVVMMPNAGRRLLRHPDLLIPLGLLIFAEAVLGWLALLPMAGPLLGAAKSVNLVGIGLSISVTFVVAIILRVAYAAWQTTLIMQATNEDRSDTIATLAVARRWFLRVLGMETVGWVVHFLGIAVAFALAPAAIVLTLIAIGLWSIVWNLATAALLPVAVQGTPGFFAALVRGISVSLAGLRHWGYVVIAQLLLLGLVTFCSVTYTEKQGANTTTKSNSNWSVNGFWTSGYEDTCRWHEKMMEAASAPKLALVTTLHGLLFGIVAILVKLHITARLPGLTRSDGPDPG